jgi:topoisomerase-4 subunit A
MESLFRLTDLETRFPLNLNVLDADGTPKVMGLKQALQAFLDHRIVVLLRRSRHRLDQIARRLEILGGYLIAYLNLDEVIRIIREEDEPKQVMIARFGLTDVQAEAILNMRLRALRRLEEIEIRKEHDALTKEQADLEQLVADPRRQRKAIAKGLEEVRAAFGTNTALGRRRTTFADAPAAVVVPITALIEREPITVVLSAKGWVRALKGHAGPDADIKYKEGDSPRWVFHAETTDRIVLFATNGRFYTLPADKLPGGRGHGEPVRLMIELGNDHELIAVFAHKPGGRLLVAAEDGRGFLVKEEEVLASTRAGKQVLNVGEGVEAKVCVPAEGDTVAVVGTNHKLLLFPLAEVPEMARGRGVTLQKYKDGGLSDAKVFTRAEGLTWPWGDRTRTETQLNDWLGARAQTGRLAPKGFPKSNRFG